YKSALGADRDDDRVLDVLRLDQAQDLGPEILRPIRPAYSAARDFAEAKMDGFQPCRIDKNLILRPRRRHRVEPAAGKLDRDDIFGAAVAIELVKIGPHRGRYCIDEVADDAIFVEAID